MDYIELSISTLDALQSDMLVAQLADAGFDGFEEEGRRLSAFIEADRFDEKAVEEIFSAAGLAYSKKIILPKNWNEEWERNFHPVFVGDFCSIRAAFHPAANKVRHDIVITPKMSFGTGHHATTYLMLQAMQRIDFSGKAVLDFGTGTGVLSILAEKCGAKTITAVDCDGNSIGNTLENISVNYCSNITVEKRDFPCSSGIFDIMLANVTKRVILQNLPVFRQHLSPGGVVLISGFLIQDRQEMEEEAAKNDLSVSSVWERESWLCLELKIASGAALKD